MTSSRILIVGAGPTGLAAAATLAKLGIKTRVIDKGWEITPQSKALGVQAGTLECLEQVFGANMTWTMREAGLPLKAGLLHLDGKPILTMNLSAIPSVYPFVLSLAQSETERILEEKLGTFSGRVERETELLNLEDNGREVNVSLRRADGSEESAAFDYVLGCDGAHSAVRHLAGIDFHGKPYGGNFILGDLDLACGWPDDAMRVYLGGRGAAAFFPLKGGKRFRVIMIPNGPAPEGGLEISLEDFKAILAELCPVPLVIEKSHWITRFRVHHRRAEKFREGKLFLLGDAAHIHSPMGGQGMNTGIQDAVNLAYKLALAAKSGDQAILDQYARERVPVADDILRVTDLGTRLVLLNQTPWLRKLIFKFAPLVGGLPFVQKRMVTALSQVTVARREIRNREGYKL